jgi:hypothetical protein
MGCSQHRNLVARDRKAHQFKGWLCSRRTGCVQHYGFGGLVRGHGRSGEEQTQRRGVNMNSAQDGGLLLSSVPDLTSDISG